MREFRALLRATWIAVAVLVSGCPSIPALFKQTTVETSQEAANVYVSAYPVVPWSEISEKLEPKHTLTTQEARKLAAVTTQAQVSQFLSTFSAGLGINLPTRTDSTQTTTTTDAAGTVEQTVSSRTRGTGAVPAASGQAPTAIADAALAADFSKLPPVPATDASTLLTVGTAVYQLAQILDNQISKAYYPAGYQAHLMTFQIALQPKARNRPYDVYVNLVLQPWSWDRAVDASAVARADASGLPPVIVYPLVISDAMESSSDARSVELIRQAALQLSGVVGKFGASAGAGAGTNALDAVVGQTRNSLVTVGRVADHALRVRLGAQYSASSGLAMIPRTHNISVVVLTRSPPAREGKTQPPAGISVTSHTEILGADDGQALPTMRSRGMLAKQVIDLVAAFGFAVRKECATSTEIMDENAIGAESALDLLRAVERQDYERIATKCIAIAERDAEKPTDRQPAPGDWVRLQNLMAALARLQVDSRYATIHVPLKPRVAPDLPEDSQLATLEEDSERGIVTFTLRGGRGLRKEYLGARLRLDEPKGKELLPVSINVADNGAQVSLSFVSPSHLEAIGGDAAANPANAPRARLQATRALVLTCTVPSEECATRTAAYDAYRLTDIGKKAQADKATQNPVSVSHTLLVPDAQGSARLTLTVAELPAESKGPLKLVVKGADVREDSQPGSAKLSPDGIVIEEDSIARVVLGNLSPAQPVTITTLTKDRTDKTGKKDMALGETIVLRVAR